MRSAASSSSSSAAGPPSCESNDADIMRAHLMDAPPELAELAPDLPPAFQVLLARMLAKSPEARHGSVDEVLAELEPILGRDRSKWRRHLRMPRAAGLPLTELDDDTRAGRPPRALPRGCARGLAAGSAVRPDLAARPGRLAGPAAPPASIPEVVAEPTRAAEPAPGAGPIAGAAATPVRALVRRRELPDGDRRADRHRGSGVAADGRHRRPAAGRQRRISPCGCVARRLRSGGFRPAGCAGDRRGGDRRRGAGRPPAPIAPSWRGAGIRTASWSPPIPRRAGLAAR